MNLNLSLHQPLPYLALHRDFLTFSFPEITTPHLISQALQWLYLLPKWWHWKSKIWPVHFLTMNNHASASGSLFHSFFIFFDLCSLVWLYVFPSLIVPSIIFIPIHCRFYDSISSDILPISCNALSDYFSEVLFGKNLLSELWRLTPCMPHCRLLSTLGKGRQSDITINSRPEISISFITNALQSHEPPHCPIPWFWLFSKYFPPWSPFMFHLTNFSQLYISENKVMFAYKVIQLPTIKCNNLLLPSLPFLLPSSSSNSWSLSFLKIIYPD